MIIKIKVSREDEWQIERELILKKENIYAREWGTKSRNNLVIL